MAFFILRSRTIRVALLVLAAAAIRASADAPEFDEYQVKAVFLYNFTKFVEWPADAFKSPSEPVAICVLGQAPFGDSLEMAARGKATATRGVVIRVVDPLHLNQCHILFMSASERRRSASILGGLRTLSILTVGETDGFTAEGGVINLKLESQRVRIEINLDAAAQARLQISSKLLSLAQIVKSPAPGK